MKKNIYTITFLLIELVIVLNSCKKTVNVPPQSNTGNNNNINAGNITSTTGAGVTFNGYAYKSIVLGNGQEWMSENLRTSTYANGDSITNGTDGTWGSLATATGAWVHYNNDSLYENPYGKLYNWYAVEDPRNVCPTGWHVPSDAEWTILIDYLGGDSVAGGKMKSTQYWISPNTEATNESGFSGLPGGMTFDGSTFDDIGGAGWWWSSSEYDTFYAWPRMLQHYFGNVYRGTFLKDLGYSIRCLKN